MSEVHVALDRLRPQICHCGLKGECLGCKGVEMVRAQAEAVVASFADNSAKLEQPLRTACPGHARLKLAGAGHRFSARFTPDVM